MATFNGYRSWAQWNVSLWLNNDEGLYSIMATFLKYDRKCGRERIAKHILTRLHDEGITHTPDGARYTITGIRAAMRGL